MPETFTAPESGWYGLSLPYRADVARRGVFEFTVHPASLLLDVPRLQRSIGQRIRVNGPNPVTGLLQRFEVDEESDRATLWLDGEVEASDA